MRKFLLTLAVLCGTVSAWAQTSLRISEGLLATQENTQYKWTSGTLTAPAENFKTLRITFMKTSNNEKPAGFPCVAIAEFYLYDKNGNAVTLTADRFSSNATHVGEGSIDKLCDNITTGDINNNDWYWHSQWDGTASPYGYHYLEIDVTDITADLSEYKIGWVTRRAQASPADVIISTGATTEEAAKNANSYMLPQVSTEIAKLYTIKSVRTKNYLRYSEENAKPVQNSSISNESYWYFTQGSDGKVVMHNVVSGKVLGTNFEMASEGEWYVSPAEYRPGVVFSKTGTITQNNCIDDQSGSIGSWSHNSGDNEGTTWLVEEVANASVDVPVFSLNNMKINSIGEAVTEIALDKWYILNNVGRGNYVSQEGNSWKMRATNNIEVGNLAKEKAGYLFKITKNGEYYNIMSGNGKFFQLGYNTASTSATPVNFEITLISNSNNNFYLLDKDHGYVADGQATGNSFVGWSTSAPTSAGGNDSYKILPVELFDVGEIGVLKEQLSEAITDAQNMYNNIKSYIGEGVGKYTAPADIETQFDAIVTFCESIDENTDLNDINAKMAELEALVASVQLNMPVAGKFYRMHNDNKYITSSVTDGGRIALSETSNDAASVYYYDGTHLLAYNTGLYMGLNASDWTFEAVGSTDISAITFVPAANGVVSKYNINSGSRWLHRTDTYVNRCSANTCGNAHNWTIEEVTELPLTIHSSGYSTFSVPVDVEIPTGVTAYYAESQDGENVKMLSIDSKIPANTGVVIKGEGTVNFTITSDATVLGNNLLKPVIAAKAVTAEEGNQVFILTTVNETTGFYPLAANSNTIGGHKSYLEIPATSSARLNIVWDETVTGIDSIEGIEKTQNAESIYNLAGQKLLKVQKGINIINGKLIVK